MQGVGADLVACFVRLYVGDVLGRFTASEAGTLSPFSCETSSTYMFYRSKGQEKESPCVFVNRKEDHLIIEKRATCSPLSNF
jgi:hypothetical protein